MTIIESVIDPEAYFQIGGLDYEKDAYTVFYRNRELDVDGNLLTNRVKVGIRSKSEYGIVIQSPISIKSWNDGAFTTLGELLAHMLPLIGFNKGGVVGNDFNISQRVNNFSELIDGEDVGELSYVEDSQGTAWLPSGMGGVYYPSGWYVWNGTIWESDRNAIANQLESNILSLDNKAPLVHTHTESDITDLDKYSQLYIDQLKAELVASIETKGGYDTGLLSFGEITINTTDNSTFDISAGFGSKNQWDGTVTNPPEIMLVAFPQFVGITPSYLATSPITYIAIDYDFNTQVSSVVQSSTQFTPEQRRDLIILGTVIHSDNTIINVVENIAAPVAGTTNQVHDLIEAIGALNLHGNEYLPASNNLAIQKTAGDIFKMGIGYSSDLKKPHQLDIALQPLVTFRYRLSESTELSDTTLINPDFYESASGVINTVPKKKWSVQRITMFQGGATRIQLGQEIYANKAEAVASFETENFTAESNIATNGIFRSFLAIKEGTTDLSNINQAEFFSVSKFGNVSGTVGAALTLANILAVIGYTPEDVANKAISFNTLNDTLYPTTKAVDDYIEGQKGNDIATLINGKLDPTQVPDLAITSVQSVSENTIVALTLNNGAYTYEEGDVIIINDGSGNLTHYMFDGVNKSDINSYSLINSSEIAISQVSGLQGEIDGKLDLTGNGSQLTGVAKPNTNNNFSAAQTLGNNLTVDGISILGDLRIVKSGATNYIQCGANRVGSTWNDVVFSPYGTGSNSKFRVSDTLSISYVDFAVQGDLTATNTISKLNGKDYTGTKATDDTDAGTKGVAIGDIYTNSVTGVLTERLT